jgi:hypothetical protein
MLPGCASVPAQIATASRRAFFTSERRDNAAPAPQYGRRQTASFQHRPDRRGLCALLRVETSQTDAGDNVCPSTDPNQKHPVQLVGPAQEPDAPN